jgi:hypothetical protein
MNSDCPPCLCDESNVLRNTLFGLTGLGSAVIIRVFWGALKRNLNYLWKKISETVVRDDEGAEDGCEDGREDGSEDASADN